MTKPHKKGKVAKQRPAFPPPFVSTLRALRVVRYSLNAAQSNLAITIKDLADVCLIALDATTGIRVFGSALKLHSVEIWAPASNTGLPVTCSVDYESSNAMPGASYKVSDTTMGITRPAHVYARPPKLSAANFWLSPITTGTLFNISGPVGAVVEVVYTGVGADDTTASAVQNALVGAAAGATYQRGLDGVAVATSVFTSIDLPQI